MDDELVRRWLVLAALLLPTTIASGGSGAVQAGPGPVCEGWDCNVGIRTFAPPREWTIGIILDLDGMGRDTQDPCEPCSPCRAEVAWFYEGSSDWFVSWGTGSVSGEGRASGSFTMEVHCNDVVNGQFDFEDGETGSHSGFVRCMCP